MSLWPNSVLFDPVAEARGRRSWWGMKRGGKDNAFTTRDFWWAPMQIKPKSYTLSYKCEAGALGLRRAVQQLLLCIWSQHKIFLLSTPCEEIPKSSYALTSESCIWMGSKKPAPTYLPHDHHCPNSTTTFSRPRLCTCKLRVVTYLLVCLSKIWWLCAEQCNNCLSLEGGLLTLYAPLETGSICPGTTLRSSQPVSQLLAEAFSRSNFQNLYQHIYLVYTAYI